jgi:hypothetical protein
MVEPSTETPETPIPDLEFRAPHCRLCGDETRYEDGGYDCETCGISWNEAGTVGQRFDGAPACGQIRTPFDKQEHPQSIRPNRYQCVLRQDHRKPCRGVLIHPRLDVEDTYQWNVSDGERTGAAARGWTEVPA